ncbi:MAG: DUF192 domain-containing protein [Deltaproteobacteria bacterium]|nr:DUF192 domain-containing protein [Deltaproteobacteria bacterium]
MRPSASWILAVISLAACEPRVDEPAAPPRPRPAERGAGTAGSSRAAVPPDRCVRRAPPAPSRSKPPAGPDPACPSDPGDAPTLRRAAVVFPEAGARVAVEVAERDADRMRGLMYRRRLPEDEGMLFVFERRMDHSFWMHNTCLPLDMLFIDGDGLVVGIEENVPTMNDSTYAAGCPSVFVLEVGAGWCRAHGVAAGQRARFEGL